MVKPIVSVIIPVYNSSQYIDKSIQSVLKQNIRLEIIVVDDCSEDGLDKKLEKYKKLDNFTYLRNTQNMGVAESRNQGVRNAQGDYIAFLDADDWWRPGKLIKQISCMKENNCVLSYTARELADDNGNLQGKIVRVNECVDYNKLLFHNSIACSSVVIKKTVALEYPMGHSEVHEDYLNWLTILKKYGKAYGIREPLMVYRISKQGKSRRKIESAKMTFAVYRLIGFGKIKASFLMTSHLFHGLLKYTRLGGRKKLHPSMLE